MKTVRFHETGEPGVLRYEDVPEPFPGPGQVKIRVEAVGVNFSDVLRRRGDDYPEASPTPFTPGSEVAGTIIELGEGVAGLAVGDAVYAVPRTGGYAQYVVVDAAMAVPLPEGIAAAEATSLVIQGLTALLSLRDAGRLSPGDTVLVEAAAGGVGAYAVQLAKLSGAGKVIAAASTPEKRAFAESLGADASVDYTEEGWPERVRELTGGRGVDIALEMVGGNILGEALRAIAPFGRMVVYGQASGERAFINPQELTVDNISVIGFYIAGYFKLRPDLINALHEIIGHVRDGRLSINIGGRFPLSRAADAHRFVEGRQSSGKVVLEPWVDV
ncbi:quinone oxidoreductase family protein [Luteibacter aegosomatissinici]|uniref:quinone oxidoreductase family protein n=1 Tax=Luteibacter aegosomatissinici TaxID=2911539 RepID=UPI001FFB75D7|nr:NADPH:quinone oxidoreductase family protein [Luteibacter aegosomatissinici]UPG92735.1 NADPH:quinone oxidoreductase family protein [Luteibacter aegosomatissinici]